MDLVLRKAHLDLKITSVGDQLRVFTDGTTPCCGHVTANSCVFFSGMEHGLTDFDSVDQGSLAFHGDSETTNIK